MMMDLFRHLRIHTQKKPKDEPEEMDFPEMYLMGLGATTELPEKFERKKKMNCYNCETELTWGGDHDLDEDEEYDILTNLSCPKCEAFVEVYNKRKDYADIHNT